MNDSQKPTRFRSYRALFLRLLPILSVVLIDIFFLAMLDNLFYNQKRTYIFLERREELIAPIVPIKDKLEKTQLSGLNLDQKKEALRNTFIKNASPVLEADNHFYRAELTDSENHLYFTMENPTKLRTINDRTNCFISRSFTGLSSTSVSDDKTKKTILNVIFYYTSPKGWPEIEIMVLRFWVYGLAFVFASWFVFIWLSRTVLRPLERVGQAIEGMIQSDGVVLIERPKHEMEQRFNQLARNQREVLFGLEIEHIVDELHSLSDDPEVVERFLAGIRKVIRNLYPFSKVDVYQYSPQMKQLISFDSDSASWPESNDSVPAFSENRCSIPLHAGETCVGGLVCALPAHTIPKDDLEAMAGEIKKQAENGLARAFTRSRALTEERNRFGINLATNMGHDLTNIIASGKWDLDTIQRAQNLGIVTMDGEKGSFFIEAVDGLRNNLHFLQEMVNIYRSFGYTRSPRYEPILLNELVEQVATLFRLSTSQKLSVQVDCSEAIEITAEPRLLRMALFNLLANAAQAIRRYDPRMLGEIAIQTKTEYGQFVLSICDNGPGIRDKEGNLLPDSAIRRIFQSGFTTKEDKSGGGLGLAWVQSIVEDFHNGSITASNRDEGGAAFIITIPLES